MSGKWRAGEGRAWPVTGLLVIRTIEQIVDRQRALDMAVMEIADLSRHDGIASLVPAHARADAETFQRRLDG